MAPGVELLVQAVVTGFARDRMEPDAEVTERRLARACVLGQLVACEQERWWRADASGLGELSHAAAVLRPQCERGGDPVACLVAAWDGLAGQSPAVDDAATLLSGACDSGLVRGCVELGTLQVHGSIAGGVDAGVARLQGACDTGSWSGCTQLGSALVGGDESAAARGLVLLHDACSAGYWPACTEVAAAEERGVGRSADPARALDGFGAACSGGHRPACDAVARLYDGGLPGVSSTARVALLSRGCAADHVTACAHVGALWLADDPPAATLAAPVLSRACDLGLASACYDVAALYAGGRGVSRDRSVALVRLKQGCDAGHGEACAEAARQLRTGRGVPRDRQQAARLMARACSLRPAPDCPAVGEAIAPADRR